MNHFVYLVLSNGYHSFSLYQTLVIVSRTIKLQKKITGHFRSLLLVLMFACLLIKAHFLINSV